MRDADSVRRDRRRLRLAVALAPVWAACLATACRPAPAPSGPVPVDREIALDGAWRVVYADSSLRVRVDTGAARALGPAIHRVRLHVEFLKPAARDPERLWTRGVRQSVRTLDLDCAGESPRRLRSRRLVHYDGAGSLITGEGASNRYWEPVDTETREGLILHQVCLALSAARLERARKA